MSLAFPARQKRKLLRRRKFVIVAALAGYLLIYTGIPMPIASHRGTQITKGQPYPCQHHHCGCAGPIHCWTGCCCYSEMEKLAWAQRHGVQPPEIFFTRDGRRRSQSKSGDQLDGSHCCHAVSKAGATGNARTMQPTRASTRGAASNTICRGTLSADNYRDPSGRRRAAVESEPANWGVVIEALKCRGVNVEWTVCGFVALITNNAAMAHDSLTTTVSDKPFLPAPQIFLMPPTPPPRSVG